MMDLLLPALYLNFEPFKEIPKGFNGTSPMDAYNIPGKLSPFLL